MARRPRERGISLPWENRGNLLGRLFARGRRRAFGAALAVAALVALTVGGVDRRARLRRTRVAVDDARRAVSAFRSDHGRCPRSMDELLHPPFPGAPYLRAAPTDGWGSPLLVRCPGLEDPDDVDVLAAGEGRSYFDDDFPR